MHMLYSTSVCIVIDSKDTYYLAGEYMFSPAKALTYPGTPGSGENYLVPLSLENQAAFRSPLVWRLTVKLYTLVFSSRPPSLSPSFPPRRYCLPLE